MNTDASSPLDMKLVIKAIPIRNVISLRDRAVLGLMVYANVSAESIISIAVMHYYALGGRFWLRLVEENSIVRRKELKPPLNQYIDEYLAAAHIEHELDRPLFRVGHGNKGRLGVRSIGRGHIQNMIQRSIELYNLNKLIKTIRSDGIVNLRDRAIIGMLLYTLASPASICRMRVGDYFIDQTGKPHIKIGKMPVLLPPPVIPLMSRYLARVPWATRSRFFLFRLDRRHQMMTHSDIREMIETRRAISR